jgi:hypothetical protein
MLSIIELVIGGTNRIKRTFNGWKACTSPKITVTILLNTRARQFRAVTGNKHSHAVGVAAGEDGTTVNVVDKGTDAEEQFAAYSGKKKKKR